LVFVVEQVAVAREQLEQVELVMEAQVAKLQA
jgi:hypothetical protein